MPTAHPTRAAAPQHELRDPGQQSRRCWGASVPPLPPPSGEAVAKRQSARGCCRILQLCPPSASGLFPNPALNRSLLEPLIIWLLCAKQLLSRNSGSPMIVKTADKKIISRVLHFKKLIEGHKGKFHTSEQKC